VIVPRAGARTLGTAYTALAAAAWSLAGILIGGVIVIGAVALQVTQGSGARDRLQRPPGDLLGGLADPEASTEPASPG
jgi:hypothetical protein